MNNPGAFLRRLPYAEALLRAVGCDLSEKTSDYEFFCAFCEASEKFSHNRLLLAMNALLAKNDCRIPIARGNAEAIWRFFSEKFFWEEPKEEEYAPDGFAGAPAIVIKQNDFVPLDLLLKQASGAADPAALESGLLKAFRASGKRGLFVNLPDAICVGQPNLYAVSKALAEKRDLTVLSLQALRIFAKEEIPLLLFLNESGTKTLAFLSRLDELVGLSRLSLVLSSASFENGVDFLEALPKSDFCAALQEADLQTLAPSLYYRYPIQNCRLLLQE